MKVPGVLVGEGGAPVPVASGEPSPNDRSHDEIVPPGSGLVDPSNVTLSGGVPAVGSGYPTTSMIA